MRNTISTYLAQIQSPDFQAEAGERAGVEKAKGDIPRGVGRGRSKSKADMSSLKAPHLKQLDRVAKLWAPQFPTLQYQSPGLTSDPPNPNPDPGLTAAPVLGSPQRWQMSLLWKLKWWQEVQFQSPGLFIFCVCKFYIKIPENKKWITE